MALIANAELPSSAASKASRPRTRERELSQFNRHVMDPPNVLVNQVYEVLQSRDGEKAMLLAKKLGACSQADLVLEQSYAQQASPEGVLSSASDHSFLRDHAQRLKAQCQTLGPQAPALHLALLKLAAEQGVMEAAGQLFIYSYAETQTQPTDPALLAQMARDALAGDAMAARFIAAPSLVLAGPTLRETLRRALALAVADPENKVWMDGITWLSGSDAAAPAGTLTDAQNQRIDEQARVVASAFKRYQIGRINRLKQVDD